MVNAVNRLKKIISTVIVISVIMCCVSCGDSKKDVFVTWLDTDGTLIESQTLQAHSDPTERALPDDSDMWHYTEWTVSQSGNVIVCTAKRTSKRHVVWKDHNGEIIKEAFVLQDEEMPSVELPENDEKWIYDGWENGSDGNQTVYQMTRRPNSDFFTGNVFQIVVKDEKGEPLASGSGFVINDDGWFVTNDHVMESGYSATAFFDIKDSENGRQYTQLSIKGGVYCDNKKDIFVGKLEGYEQIKQHYKKIGFTEEYTVGDKTYSVGYPNSSVKIEINGGSVLEEYTDIHSKIDGIYYVLSDSYIAPGSSGGVLVNESFDVIGITTIGMYSDSNKNNYMSGGSIPYLLFKQNLKDLRTSNIKPLFDMYKN